MTDFMKNVFDAWGERIRSPIIGSVLLAHLSFNWSSYFYLFFAETDAPKRIAYFQDNTTLWTLFVYPGITGLIIAFVIPYVTWFGAILSRTPKRWLSDVQEDEASKKRIRKLKAETAELEERKKHELAKRRYAAELQAEAEKDIIDFNKRLKMAEDVSSETKDEVLKLREVATANERQELGEYANKILLRAKNGKTLKLTHQKSYDFSKKTYAGIEIGTSRIADEGSYGRKYSELLTGIQELKSRGLLQELTGTNDIYAYYDILPEAFALITEQAPENTPKA